jgi:hypothetical protein
MDYTHWLGELSASRVSAAAWQLLSYRKEDSITR